jgi:hypothetical protein
MSERLIESFARNNNNYFCSSIIRHPVMNVLLQSLVNVNIPNLKQNCVHGYLYVDKCIREKPNKFGLLNMAMIT